jgi:hypothetical protein
MGLEMARMTRKTFSGGGRPRSMRPREPSGRLQRPSATETAAEVVAVVLSQPHRRGDTAQGRRWAIGRLILGGAVKVRGIEASTLERAAEMYAADYARLRWIMDSKRPWHHSTGPTPPEPTLDDKERIGRAWSDVRAALRDHYGGQTKAELDAGGRLLKAVELAILDDPSDEHVLAQWIVLSLPDAMRALAVHYGLVGR